MFRFIIVVLLATAINCGHLRSPASFRSRVAVQQLQPVLNSPNLLVSQIPVIQPFERIIPSSLVSPLVTDFQTIPLPQTVPQYLTSLPQTVEFVIPKSVPLELLSITAPQTSAQSSVQTLSTGSVQTLPSQLVSPAQKARSQPVISSTPIEAPVARQPLESPETPVAGQPLENPETPVARQPLENPETPVPQTSAQNLDNSFESLRTSNESANTGFSTPTKPLNFAPNLPEVNKLSKSTEQRISQSVDNQRVEKTRQQIREPVVQQRVEQIREPIVQQRVEQIREPIVQQRVEQIREPIVQQRVEQIREPIVQQRVEQIREPIVQQRIAEPITQQRIETIPQYLKNPSVGLNSY